MENKYLDELGRFIDEWDSLIRKYEIDGITVLSEDGEKLELIAMGLPEDGKDGKRLYLRVGHRLGVK